MSAATTTEARPGRETDHGSVPSPERRRVRWGSRLSGSWTLLAFLAIFIGYAVWLGDKFLVVQNRLFDIHSVVPILLLGLAAVVTLVAGKFDLSIAGMATLGAFLTIGLATRQDIPVSVVILLVLAIGVVGGLINAALVVGIGINTFIATLGTSGLFLGISAVYSGGTQLAPASTDTPLPEWFSSFGSFVGKPPAVLIWLLIAVALAALLRAALGPNAERADVRTWTARAALVAAVVLLFVFDVKSVLLDMSWASTALLLVAFALWVLLDKTVFGRELRATGSNPEAARLAGVRTARAIIAAYALGGLLAALAGVVAAASLGAAQPNLGGPLLLPAFAAAFLSTVLFSKGHFNVWGTVVGGIFLQWVSQGLVNGGLAFTWNDFINGFVLILAVSISSLVARSSSSSAR